MTLSKRERDELRRLERDIPAAKSAARFLLDQWENRPCDSKGVNCCVRCNSVSAARWLLEHCDALPALLDAADREQSLREGLQGLVPTNWCDPLLTGPNKVIGQHPYSGIDIELLLQALNKRVEKLLNDTADQTAGGE